MTKGSCLCGAVTFVVSGDLRPVVACHCQQCRKSSGHYFAATSAHRKDVDIQGSVGWFQASQIARRGFCATCGSNLFWDGPGQNLSILAGCLDGQTGLKLVGHIYCADKGDYYEITDGLPQAESRNPDITTMVP